MKKSEMQWFIGLWLLGFLALGIIAAIFRGLLLLAY